MRRRIESGTAHGRQDVAHDIVKAWGSKARRGQAAPIAALLRPEFRHEPSYRLDAVARRYGA